MDRPPQHRLESATTALRALEGALPARPGRVRLELGRRVAWLRLDNPAAHNAMTVRMMRELAEAVGRLQEWSGAVVAVASAHGGTFCAGGHLGQVRQALLAPENAQVMSMSMAVVLDALGDLDCLSVAVLEGAAIGGGAEIATATDLRVAHPDASVHWAQVQLGVTAGWGGAARLVRQIGRARAMSVVARAERLTADRALALGLVESVARGSAQELLDAALGPAADHPVAALRAAKQQVRDHADPRQQVDAFLSVWGGSHHRHALGLEAD